MKRLTGIILGAAMIICGAVYFLVAFGMIDMDISFDGWWALFIIVPAITGIVTSNDKLLNIFFLWLGVYLLLAAQGVITYALGWELTIPVAIVLIGLKMIIKSVNSQNCLVNKPITDENVKKRNMSAFCSKEYDYSGEEIAIAKVSAVFGGSKCNLTDAKITDGACLDLFCMFGGAEIIVPNNINVKINTFCLFGGISDKRIVKPDSENNVTLTVNGCCIFGGADIKQN